MNGKGKAMEEKHKANHAAVSTVKDLAVGTAAGLVSSRVMGRITTLLYEHTSPEAILREQEIEPLDPMAVLAKKVEDRLRLSFTEEERKRLATLFDYGLSISMSTLYVNLARRLPFNWLTWGTAFGLLYFAVMDEAVAPAMGLVGDNRKYPLEAHLRGVAGHLAFALTTAAIARGLGIKPRKCLP